MHSYTEGVNIVQLNLDSLLLLVVMLYLMGANNSVADCMNINRLL